MYRDCKFTVHICLVIFMFSCMCLFNQLHFSNISCQLYWIKALDFCSLFWRPKNKIKLKSMLLWLALTYHAHCHKNLPQMWRWQKKCNLTLMWAFVVLKRWSTASAQLSAYAYWSPTHRQSPYRRECGNGRTDATKYIISPLRGR